MLFKNKQNARRAFFTLAMLMDSAGVIWQGLRKKSFDAMPNAVHIDTPSGMVYRAADPLTAGRIA